MKENKKYFKSAKILIIMSGDGWSKYTKQEGINLESKFVE